MSSQLGYISVGKKGIGGSVKWNFLKRAVLEPGVRVPISYQAIFDDPWIKRIDPIPPSRIRVEISPITNIIIKLQNRFPLLGDPYYNVDDPSIQPSLLESYAWKVYKLKQHGYSLQRSFKLIEKSIAHEQMIRRLEFQSLQEKLALTEALVPDSPLDGENINQEETDIEDIPESFFYNRLEEMKEHGIYEDPLGDKQNKVENNISKELTFLGLVRFLSSKRRPIQLNELTFQETELVQMYLPKYPEHAHLFGFLEDLPSLSEAIGAASLVPFIEELGFKLDTSTGSISYDRGVEFKEPTKGSKWSPYLKTPDYDPRRLSLLRKMAEERPEIQDFLIQHEKQRLEKEKSLLSSKEIEFNPIKRSITQLDPQEIEKLFHPKTEREILFGASFTEALDVLKNSGSSSTFSSLDIDSHPSTNFNQLLEKANSTTTTTTSSATMPINESKIDNLLFEYYHRTIYEKEYSQLLKEYDPENPPIELIDPTNPTDSIDAIKTMKLPHSEQVHLIDSYVERQSQIFEELAHQYEDSVTPPGINFDIPENFEFRGKQALLSEIKPKFWNETQENYKRYLEVDTVDDISLEFSKQFQSSDSYFNPEPNSKLFEKHSLSFTTTTTEEDIITSQPSYGSIGPWVRKLKNQTDIFQQFKPDLSYNQVKFVEDYLGNSDFKQEEKDEDEVEGVIEELKPLVSHITKISKSREDDELFDEIQRGYKEDVEKYENALKIRTQKDEKFNQWMDSEVLIQRNKDKQEERKFLREPLIASKAQMVSDDKVSLMRLIKNAENIETDVSWDPTTLESLMEEYGYKYNTQIGEWNASENLPESLKEEFDELARSIPRSEDVFNEQFKDIKEDEKEYKFEEFDIQDSARNRKVVDLKVSANKYSDIFTSNPTYEKFVKGLNLEYTNYRISKSSKKE